MYRLLLFLIMSSSGLIFGQSDKIQLRFKWDDKTIELQKQYPTEQSENTVVFTKIQLYVSLRSPGGDPGVFYLVDLSEKESTQLPFERVFEKQILQLGVDSSLHQKGVFEGALDPINGMYWAWQSGYINLKLEGYFLDKENRKEFAYHIGGYKFPYATNSVLEINPDDQEIEFALNAVILGQNKTHIMSPGKEAYSFFQTFLESTEIH